MYLACINRNKKSHERRQTIQIFHSAFRYHVGINSRIYRSNVIYNINLKSHERRQTIQIFHSTFSYHVDGNSRFYHRYVIKIKQAIS